MDYVEAFDCLHHKKMWKIFEETAIPDHLTHLLRNLYSGQAATVGTAHTTMYFFKIGNEYFKGFPDSSTGKESSCNEEDPGLIPGFGRSPGEGIGYPLQYS